MLYGPFRVLPGRLSVSRTFGDIEAKMEKFGGLPGVVTAEPEISQFTIEENKHDFIILGCDGIFDRLSSLNVIDSAWSAMSYTIKT
jgi:protein phosphatase 2C family protein 2/3